MHEDQLQQFRRAKWRLTGEPIRTMEEAREFVDPAGFCLLYAQRPPVLLPTFCGACKGSDEKLPTGQTAFKDPDAARAKELMVRLLREKAAYEANVFPDNNFIVSAAVFPYFYGLVGDRNPREAPKAGARSEYSQLAIHAFQQIDKRGPISKQRLREVLGGEPSEAALDRALDELWAKLRITRVDYKPDEGVFWDVLHRWSPEAVREGVTMPVAGAVTALVSKYLDCVLAVSQDDLEQFFSHFTGRARVREAVNALQAARELTFVHVGGRVMLQSVSSHEAIAQELKATTPVEEPKPRVPRALLRDRRPGPSRQRPFRSRRPDPRTPHKDTGKE
jgi:hypothetical protein